MYCLNEFFYHCKYEIKIEVKVNITVFKITSSESYLKLKYM